MGSLDTKEPRSEVKSWGLFLTWQNLFTIIFLVATGGVIYQKLDTNQKTTETNSADIHRIQAHDIEQDIAITEIRGDSSNTKQQLGQIQADQRVLWDRKVNKTN